MVKGGAPSAGEDKQAVQEIQDMIDNLREKTKKQDPNVDVNKELRKIQDKCADLKGEPRRPKTGAVPKEDEKKEKEKEKERKKKEKEEKKKKEEEEKKKKEEEEKQKEAEEQKKKEKEKKTEVVAAAAVVDTPLSSAPTDEIEDQEKDLVDKRLKTIMLVALSFEKDYPKDFYQKLSESGKLKEVLKPITKDELKVLNKLLGERGIQCARDRVEGNVPNMSKYTYS